MNVDNVQFRGRLTATPDVMDSWSVVSGTQEALCSIPKEFGGSSKGFSPEDFFLQAAMNCFVGTFKVYARMSKIGFSALDVEGHLQLGKGDQGKVIMKKVHLDIRFQGVDREDRARTLVEKVLKDGFILNSIKTEISYDLTFSS